MEAAFENLQGRSQGEMGSDRRSGRVKLRTPTLEMAMQVKLNFHLCKTISH
jgi:hypothetical protein